MKIRNFMLLFSILVVASCQYTIKNPPEELNLLMSSPYIKDKYVNFCLLDTFGKDSLMKNPQGKPLLIRTFTSSVNQDFCTSVYYIQKGSEKTKEPKQDDFFACLVILGKFEKEYDEITLKSLENYILSIYKNKSITQAYLNLIIKFNLDYTQKLLETIRKTKNYLEEEYQKQGKNRVFTIKIKNKYYSVERVIEEAGIRFIIMIK